MFLIYLKIEFKRVLDDIKFWIAIILGCVISIMHFIEEVLPEAQYALNDTYPISVFNSWIGVDISMHFLILCYIAPLLAGFAIGTSYFKDKKSGYLKSIFTRSEKSVYYIAKYIVTFFTGFSVAVIPLVVNLILTMQVLPMVKPQGNGWFPLLWNHTFYELMQIHPMIYTLIYICISGILVGTFTLIVFVIADFIDNLYVMYFVPFVVFILLHFISNYSGFGNWSPINMENPIQIVTFDPLAFCILTITLILSTLLYTIYKAYRKDVL